MSEVAEDTLLGTITQFLSEVDFKHAEPVRWDDDGGRGFLVRSSTALDNGLFKIEIHGEEQSQRVMFYCAWDVHVPPRKRAEAAELIVRLNYDLGLGNLEMDYRDGEVRYKSTLAYEGIPLNFSNLRTHFYTTMGMMDRCAPWIESMIIGEYTAAEAAVRAREPQKSS